MEFYEEPRVELVAITRLNPDWQPEEWGLPAAGGDPPVGEAAALIEFAGRQCYCSWNNPSGRTNWEYVANLLAQNHLSVLEHVSATLRLRQVSRSFSHEMVRHRHLSFSQLSQRYVDSRAVGFVVPPRVREDAEARRTFERGCEAVQYHYQALCDAMSAGRGVGATASVKSCREAARSLLPNATATEMLVTGNLTAWRWFLKMRTSMAAEAEMRQVALAVLALLREGCPPVFADFERREQDGQGFAATHLTR